MPHPRIPSPMGNLLATKSFEVLATDFTFLKQSSDGGELNVLVMTDVFSKFTVVVIPTRGQKPVIAAKVLVKN